MKRVLLATGRAYPPYQNGGAQLSLHAQALGLLRRGWEVEALTGLSSGLLRTRLYRLKHVLSMRRVSTTQDRLPGYPTHRTVRWHADAALRSLVRTYRPSVVVVDDLDLVAAIPAGVPVVISFVDVEFLRNGVASLPLERTPGALACSQFVADRVREQFGYTCRVAHPIVDLAGGDESGPNGRFITLVNPVRQKGVDVVLDVARRLPHRSFLLQESWPLSGERGDDLAEGMRGLENVRLRGWTPDMTEVYAQTKLLLTPSRWFEGFGRVVVEAQARGIPVVAAQRGGLPEAVGSGGVLMAPDASAEQWAALIEEILLDPARYDDLSAKARHNTRRRDLSEEHIIDQVERELQATIGGGPSD
jgi:glycosyltransferase involved in cell wall biosynthesis